MTGRSETWWGESRPSCVIAFVSLMNGWIGAALSARRHAGLTSEHSLKKQGKWERAPRSPPLPLVSL